MARKRRRLPPAHRRRRARRAAGRVRGRPCGRRSGGRQDGDGDAGQRQPCAARHRSRRSTDDEHRSGRRPDRGPTSAARRVAVGARGLEPRSSGRGRALGAWAVHPDRFGSAGRRRHAPHRRRPLHPAADAANVASSRAATPPAPSLCVALLDGEPQRGHAVPVPIAQLAERIAVGGWPAHLGSSATPAMRVNRGYLDDIRRTDISRLDGRSRDPARVGRLLQSLARNLATPVSVAKLAADVGGNGTAMKADTAAWYLDALERLMVVEHQPAWSPHLRSRTTLRSTPVRHFVDPSLAVAALGGRASPAALAGRPRVLRLPVRIHGHPRLAHLRASRRRRGVPLSGEGRPGRWMPSSKLPMGAGPPSRSSWATAGWTTAQGICAGWPGEWRTATTAHQPPLPSSCPADMDSRTAEPRQA